MAQLTWRDVAAPNLGNPQDSINAAARLLASSTTGLSGALTQFGDQQALQQLAAYTDAQKLQADIQSGRFNTANASGEALASIMSRPADLLTNAINQQNIGFNEKKIPLVLDSLQNSNNAAVQTYNQNELTNPLAVNALKRTDALGAAGQPDALAALVHTARLNELKRPVEFATAQQQALATGITNTDIVPAARSTVDTAQRTRAEQENTRLALQQVGALQSQGKIPSAVEGNAYFQQLVDAGTDPIVLNAVKGALEKVHGAGTIGAVTTSVGGSVPTPVANILNNAAGGNASVGERNNNQGNLMGTGWVTSMPGYLGNDEKGFARFSTNEQGTAANNKQLERYWEGTEATGGKPVRTIDGIINTWAPVATANAATGNSPESVANYKKYVQTRTGIDMTKELTKEQLGPVRAAMQEFETGNRPTTQQLSNTSAATTPVNTVLAKAATTTPAATAPTPAPATATGESGDVFALRRKFQTLTQQSGAVSSQDNTEFSTRIVNSLNTPINISQAFAEIRKDPTFANVHESTIVSALNKAQEVSGLTNFAPLAEAVKMSLSGNTEFNTTKGAPWFTGTFDYNKLEKFAKQAGDLAEAIKNVDGATKRKDDLAQVAFLMPQIEALNTERISLYQQKQLGKSGAAAALAKVDERIKGYMDLVNPLISGYDKELNSRVKNSPSTEAEIKAAADARALLNSINKPTAAGSSDPAALLAAADKVKAPVRSTDGGKTWTLEIDSTIRNPDVKYYQEIANPVYTKLNGKTFKSRAEAEKAYKNARKS